MEWQYRESSLAPDDEVGMDKHIEHWKSQGWELEKIFHSKVEDRVHLLFRRSKKE